jgi:adenosine deaminase
VRDTAALGDEGNQVNEASVSYPKIVVASLAEHPLPELVAAGVRCSVSTDDPAMFGTDLGTEYRTAARLGVPPQVIYQAGVQGALCDEETRAALRRVGEACASATGRGGDQAT